LRQREGEKDFQAQWFRQWGGNKRFCSLLHWMFIYKAEQLQRYD